MVLVVVCGGQGIFNSINVHVIVLRNASFCSNSSPEYALLCVEVNFILQMEMYMYDMAAHVLYILYMYYCFMLVHTILGRMGDFVIFSTRTLILLCFF